MNEMNNMENGCKQDNKWDDPIDIEKGEYNNKLMEISGHLQLALMDNSLSEKTKKHIQIAFDVAQSAAILPKKE